MAKACFLAPEFRLGKRVSVQGERCLGIEVVLLACLPALLLYDIRCAMCVVRCTMKGKMHTMCGMRGGLQLSSKPPQSP